MNAMLKSTLALFALVAAFYLSISYRYGDPGWRLEVHTPAASADVGSDDNYDLKSIDILNRAVIHLKENYVDPSRINERKMIGAAMEAVQQAIAELLVEVDRDSEKVPIRITVRIDRAEKSFDLKGVGNLWQMSFKFKDIFSFLQKHLYTRDTLREVEYAAINGMLSTLDPHSVLLRPEDYQEMKLATRGKFGGLGIVISLREGVLEIVNPIEDTPASRAGLLAGDRIVQIGLDSTVNMALSDAVDLLRGPPNTPVDIHVQREGWKRPRKFTLRRANIKVKSVTYKKLPKKVGWVKIRNFQNTTFNELKAALRSMGTLKGLILDLRGNPGGLLDQAIKMSDLFIESGALVTTVGYRGKVREPKMATRSGTLSYPVVVLINSSSASASEIVAGALKNHERALIIGRQTFGKGSVQVIYDNKDDSALKLTIAQYLTPGDLSIQSVGITPDISTLPVVLTKDTTLFFEQVQSRGAEKDLPSHLEHASSTVAKSVRPFQTIRYLRDEALHTQIMKSPNTLLEDFEVTLARRFIAASKLGFRNNMLKAAATVLSETAQQQERHIIAALKKRSIDWNQGVKGGGQCTVSVKTDATEHTVEAGKTLMLTATVHNASTQGSCVRLRAVTQSDNDYFDGHELIFGNVAPQEDRVWTVPIKLSKSALSRSDTVKLVFNSEGADPLPEAALTLSVKQLPRPRFAMTYQLDDQGEGNGDGILQPGEKAELVVQIKNVGEGRSYGLLAMLTGAKKVGQREVFVRRGRVRASQDGLLPGEQAEVRFGFTVKATAGAEVEVLVTGSDVKMRESTTEKITFHVVAAQDALVIKTVRLLPRTGQTLSLSGLYGDTLPLGTAPFAVAGAHLGDWYRVLNTNGLFYWINANAVTVDPAGQGTTVITPITPEGPPVIALNNATQLTTQSEAMTLSGKILGKRWIKDLLIYVNNRKVFFKSNQNKGEQLRFSARLPLKEGVNQIVVVAREDDEFSSRRVLYIHRDTP